jgi:hypothetical protein
MVVGTNDVFAVFRRLCGVDVSVGGTRFGAGTIVTVEGAFFGMGAMVPQPAAVDETIVGCGGWATYPPRGSATITEPGWATSWGSGPGNKNLETFSSWSDIPTVVLKNSSTSFCTAIW